MLALMKNSCLLCCSQKLSVQDQSCHIGEGDLFHSGRSFVQLKKKSQLETSILIVVAMISQTSSYPMAQTNKHKIFIMVKPMTGMCKTLPSQPCPPLLQQALWRGCSGYTVNHSPSFSGFFSSFEIQPGDLAANVTSVYRLGCCVTCFLRTSKGDNHNPPGKMGN